LVYNFWHERTEGDDRHLRHFVTARDYLHDSRVDQIHIDQKLGTVVMELFSERDWEPDPERRGEIHTIPHRPYTLTFADCVYVEASNLNGPWEYSNARLKDSPRLARIQADTRRRYLHVRINFVSTDYLDIIFRTFFIESDGKPVELPARVWRPIALYFPRTECARYEINELRRMVASRGTESYLAMSYLAFAGDVTMCDQAAKALRTKTVFEKWEELWTASVWALGHLGNQTHLAVLGKALDDAETPIMRRHVLDAIEKIAWRRGRSPKTHARIRRPPALSRGAANWVAIAGRVLYI
jgi:hypothetical protein